MQHHTHPPRPPHMRGHHMHPQQHITMNLGPSSQQQQQQNASPTPLAHKQQAHHMSNGPVLGLPPANAQQLQQHQQHKSSYMPPNRLSHQQQQQQHQQQHHLMQTQQQPQMQRVNPQAIHTTNQMQKIRQQHQLVNSSSSNNNNNSNNNPHQQQHMGVRQQHLQRNIQGAHNVTHMKPHEQQHASNVIPPASLLNQHQQEAHVLPTTSPGSVQQHCYPGGGKTKYNNSANVVAPKSILQNPNRSLRRPTTKVAAALAENAVDSVEANDGIMSNIEDASEAIATPVVSAKLVTTSLQESSTLPPTSISEEDKSAEVTLQANQKHTPSTNDCDELPSDNVISCGDSNSGSSKEKTPMCLVNELARFNKITHQYRLTSEKGPPHCKRFTVTLKLGGEEYSAEGYKIKKAQHLAASEAIEKTKYKHPVPKIIRRSEDGISRSIITPTVELNALAMKLGQQTYYLFDPRQQPPPDAVIPPPQDLLYRGGMIQTPPPHSGGPPPRGPPMMPPPPHHMMDGNPYMRRNANGVYPQRFPHRAFPHPHKFSAHPRYPILTPLMGGHNIGGMPHHHSHGPSFAPPPTTPCKITLMVGKQKFVGSGRTLQAAKHDAASRALQVLKTQAANKLNELLNRSIEDSDSKSPISLVHEIAVKRSMTVHFKVLREEGPAHMKNFITACIVGKIVTEGEGNGKKISKKHAAEKMLEELNKLPPISPAKSPVKRIRVKPPAKACVVGAGTTPSAAAAGSRSAERKKRPGGASIKEKSEAEIADNDNPISKLIVLLQSRKEKEPVYELISKNGNENTRRREFIMEVSAAGRVERGSGNNKKVAKRNAAQNLLDAMCGVAPFTLPAATEHDQLDTSAHFDIPEGHNCDLVSEVTKTIAMPAASEVEPAALPLVKTTSGQVPGILILRQDKKNSAAKNEKHTEAIMPKEPTKETVAKTDALKETAVATPTTDTSETNNTTSTLSTSTSSNSSSTSASAGLRMKHQLLYLAQLLGFEVDFNDYPKGNHNEYLTIVTLSTTPAQICHGTGANSEESQNDAAKNALKILSELGLNNVKSK